MYAERHPRDAPCDGLVLLRVADPRHAEVGRREDDRRHGLELAVPEQAYVLQPVRLLDVADGVLDPPSRDVAFDHLPERRARRVPRGRRQQHHRLLAEAPGDDHVQEPVRDVREPHRHHAELDRHALFLSVVVELHHPPVRHAALPGELPAHDRALPAPDVPLLQPHDEVQALRQQEPVEPDVVPAPVVDAYAAPLRVPRHGPDDALHLVVLAHEPGRVRGPQPEMQRDRPAPPALAGDRHAAPEAEVVAHVAPAAVPDLGEVLHLLRVGLLHVGRVEDYERVPADPPRALCGDDVVHP